MNSWWQGVLVLGAALVLVSAFLVAFVVIPLVRADTFPGAAPDRAVPAFWANVLLSLLVAAAAVTSSRLGSNRSTLRRALAGVLGLLALVLGLFLIDAAIAFSRHGAGMHGAVVALWACVCLDVAAGIGMVWSALARRR
jgi:hypothetical protein